jgi:nucleotide-binding universal stress UspA family protein
MNHNGTTQRIVVGVDGSAYAAHAALWAAGLAALRGSTLHLVHALDVTGASSLLTRLSFDEYKLRRTKDGEELLDIARADLLRRFPGLWVTGEITEADPVQALVALSADAALVVAESVGTVDSPACRSAP